MSDFKSYIKLLDLSENFNADDLKKAYRQKVLQYHPDKAKNEAERVGYEALMKKLNEAYEELKKHVEEDTEDTYEENNEYEEECEEKYEEDINSTADDNEEDDEEVNNSYNRCAQQNNHNYTNSFRNNPYSQINYTDSFYTQLKIAVFVIVVLVIAVIFIPKDNTSSYQHPSEKTTQTYKQESSTQSKPINYSTGHIGGMSANSDNVPTPSGKPSNNTIYSSGQSSNNAPKPSLPVAQKEPNWNLYKQAFTKAIKAEWYPMTGTESMPIALRFNINKSGRFSNITVVESNGAYWVEREAILPLNRIAGQYPLPEEYKGNSIDVELRYPELTLTIIGDN